jgi:hypothetical protein
VSNAVEGEPALSLCFLPLPCLFGCHPRRGSAVVCPLVVIPEGNLLLSVLWLSSLKGICCCLSFWLSSPKGICCCLSFGCHPRRGSAVVLASLAVIPEGDLLLPVLLAVIPEGDLLLPVLLAVIPEGDLLLPVLVVADGCHPPPERSQRNLHAGQLKILSSPIQTKTRARQGDSRGVSVMHNPLYLVKEEEQGFRVSEPFSRLIS